MGRGRCDDRTSKATTTNQTSQIHKTIAPKKTSTTDKTDDTRDSKVSKTKVRPRTQ